MWDVDVRGCCVCTAARYSIDVLNDDVWVPGDDGPGNFTVQSGSLPREFRCTMIKVRQNKKPKKQVVTTIWSVQTPRTRISHHTLYCPRSVSVYLSPPPFPVCGPFFSVERGKSGIKRLTRRHLFKKTRPKRPGKRGETRSPRLRGGFGLQYATRNPAERARGFVPFSPFVPCYTSISLGKKGNAGYPLHFSLLFRNQQPPPAKKGS
jgi:uncharacterized C2H2 Zn-finger protein